MCKILYLNKKTYRTVMSDYFNSVTIIKYLIFYGSTKLPIVTIPQITKDKTLTISKKLFRFFSKCIIPMTKKIICAIRNGIVNISLKTPIKTKSIL